MKRISTPLVIAATAIVVSASANATTLFQFSATGEVSSINVPTGINEGDAASLSFVFDAETLDLNPSAVFGQYVNPYVGEIVGVFGGETFRTSTPGQRMDVRLLSFGDHEFTGSTNINAASDSGTFNNVQLQFRFADDDRTAFTTDALPTSLQLSDFQGLFDTATFTVTGPGVGTIRAQISDVSISRVAPVPLPAASWLMLAALGGLTLVRRRKTT